jgi:hypothetical protein
MAMKKLPAHRFKVLNTKMYLLHDTFPLRLDYTEGLNCKVKKVHFMLASAVIAWWILEHTWSVENVDLCVQDNYRPSQHHFISSPPPPTPH